MAFARRDRRGHTRELILDGTGAWAKRRRGSVRFLSRWRPEPVEGHIRQLAEISPY